MFCNKLLNFGKGDGGFVLDLSWSGVATTLKTSVCSKASSSAAKATIPHWM